MVTYHILNDLRQSAAHISHSCHQITMMSHLAVLNISDDVHRHMYWLSVHLIRRDNILDLQKYRNPLQRFLVSLRRLAMTLDETYANTLSAFSTIVTDISIPSLRRTTTLPIRFDFCEPCSQRLPVSVAVVAEILLTRYRSYAK